jgi:hypothetical protein
VIVPMRIEIVGDDSMSAQARTYAEYRLFAALSQVVDTNQVRSASLVLRRAKVQTILRWRSVHRRGRVVRRRGRAPQSAGGSSLRRHQPGRRADSIECLAFAEQVSAPGTGRLRMRRQCASAPLLALFRATCDARSSTHILKVIG